MIHYLAPMGLPHSSLPIPRSALPALAGHRWPMSAYSRLSDTLWQLLHGNFDATYAFAALHVITGVLEATVMPSAARERVF